MGDTTRRGLARLDFGTIRNVERTPIGGMRVDAAITRCGILVYRDTAGNEFREYVPADEVFRVDSLATLRDAPVTDGHPSDLVTPDTFRTVARGHVSDTPRREDDLACAPLAIDDGALVRAIDAGERKDISAGYTCDIDPTPGVYEGQPYDRIQRNRRYNHVAVLPPGAGRAGPEVSLRMDGAAVQVRVDARAEEQRIVKTPAPITFRGREYKFDEAAGNYGTLEKDMDAAANELTAMKKDAAGHDAAISAVQQALATAMGEVAKLKADLDAVQSAIAEEEAQEGEGETSSTEAAPEEVLDSMRAVRREVVRAVGVSGLKKGMRRDAVRALVSKTLDTRADSRAEEIARVRTDAVKHLTPDECKGKSVDELRRAVIAKLAPTVKMDSLDAKTIATTFDAIVAVAKPADAGRRDSAASNGALNAALNTPRKDGEDNSLEALYAKDREEAANRWKSNGSK